MLGRGDRCSEVLRCEVVVEMQRVRVAGGRRDVVGPGPVDGGERGRRGFEGLEEPGVAASDGVNGRREAEGFEVGLELDVLETPFLRISDGDFVAVDTLLFFFGEGGGGREGDEEAG